jgi:hypothetical protein
VVGARGTTGAPTARAGPVGRIVFDVMPRLRAPPPRTNAFLELVVLTPVAFRVP